MLDEVLLPWEVPQGFLLGPLRISIYILPLGKIFRQHTVPFLFYANDCQIYPSMKPSDSL